MQGCTTLPESSRAKTQTELRRLISISRSLVEKMSQQKLELEQTYALGQTIKHHAAVHRYLELNQEAQQIFQAVRRQQATMAQQFLDDPPIIRSQFRSA